jgi:putative aldouronate transport system substrate-binding protein
MDRRSFLRMASASSIGLSFLVEACTQAPQASPTLGAAPTSAAPAKPTSPPPAAAPTQPAAAPEAVPKVQATPASALAAASRRLRLPAYVPIEGAKADLPATADGLQAGYLSYPQTLVKTVTQPPGMGGDVTALTSLPFSPPPPVEDNPAWQAINKELNANMKIRMVPAGDAYVNAVATTMAGGDLPDLFYFNAFGPTTSDLPQFLKTAYTDLTPFVAGDAVKEYPNLAAFPTASWIPTVFDGAIFGIPIVRPAWNYVWYVNQTWLEAIGGSRPKTADEFKRILVDMTRPQSNQWGIGAGAPAYGLVNGRGDCPQLAMFNAPNNWKVDSAGKFTKDFETEEFKAALGYVRDLYAAGVFYPDPVPLNSTILKTAFIGGKIGVVSTGWASYAVEFWDAALKMSPPVKIRTLPPFSHDGGKPTWHQFTGLIGMTAIKKAPPERVKEILRILNYLAAPFGSQESLLLEYGVKGIDFNFDAQGNPVKTDKGRADTNVMWQYLAWRSPVLFYPADPEFAKVAYADTQAMVPALLADPSLGLYSRTDRSKGGSLIQSFSDGLGPIVTGQSPLSAFDQVLKDWRTAGGDQMRQEYEQAYAESMK